MKKSATGSRETGHFKDPKKTEYDLHIQKTHLEALFNSVTEAIVLHDNNDIVVDINDEFTKMFGYTRKEAIGKPINDLVASEELKEHAGSISAKVLNGQKVNLEAKRVRKDGSIFDVSILGAPILNEGKEIGVYAIYRDISEHKKVEEEIHLQKTYLEILFNSAPEAIVLHGNDDLIVNVNDEFVKMFGYTREEVIGSPINKIVASEDYEEDAKKQSSMVLSGKKVNVETRRRRKDGTLFDVWVLGAPIFNKGIQLGVYAIYRDITERKRAEEARIKAREEARMAKNIQLNFLPKNNPDIINYDIAGKNIPALNVGGDYYDFISLDQRRLAIGLGDVSGKGLPASLVMANLQATIRGQALLNATAKECLESSNKLLFHNTDRQTFVSLFYGILNTEDNTLLYCNAGQNIPLIFSAAKKPVPIKTHGLALGIKENVVYNMEKVNINSGDILLIYSDGISEAMNEKMEEFGEERLLAIVEKNRKNSAVSLIDNILDAVNLHFGTSPQNDDMTIIILKREIDHK